MRAKIDFRPSASSVFYHVTDFRQQYIAKKIFPHIKTRKEAEGNNLNLRHINHKKICLHTEKTFIWAIKCHK